MLIAIFVVYKRQLKNGSVSAAFIRVYRKYESSIMNEQKKKGTTRRGMRLSGQTTPPQKKRRSMRELRVDAK